MRSTVMNIGGRGLALLLEVSEVVQPRSRRPVIRATKTVEVADSGRRECHRDVIARVPLVGERTVGWINLPERPVGEANEASVLRRRIEAGCRRNRAQRCPEPRPGTRASLARFGFWCNHFSIRFSDGVRGRLLRLPECVRADLRGIAREPHIEREPLFGR
jgi:hypothetical protein